MNAPLISDDKFITYVHIHSWLLNPPNPQRVFTLLNVCCYFWPNSMSQDAWHRTAHASVAGWIRGDKPLTDGSICAPPRMLGFVLGWFHSKSPLKNRPLEEYVLVVWICIKKANPRDAGSSPPGFFISFATGGWRGRSKSTVNKKKQ